MLTSLRVLGVPQCGIQANLQEFLPTEVYQMTQLEIFNIFNPTRISGTIPTELAQLTNLHFLDLARHKFLTGTIPTQLGLLTKLTHLQLLQVSLGVLNMLLGQCLT